MRSRHPKTGKTFPSGKARISDINIRFAVGQPERPWNRERIYSRAARNMPEFQPIKRAAPPKSEPSATKHAGTKTDAKRPHSIFADQPDQTPLNANPVWSENPRLICRVRCFERH
jgi:hypothetical protein